MYQNQNVGKKGEEIAYKYLIKNNYEVLERNFRCKQGEIDIIAKDNLTQELAFVEVKTRSTLKYGRPSEAVKKFKQKHIINVAKYYTYINKIYYIPIRFDIIEIILDNNNYKINHIKQAFGT